MPLALLAPFLSAVDTLTYSTSGRRPAPAILPMQWIIKRLVGMERSCPPFDTVVSSR